GGLRGESLSGRRTSWCRLMLCACPPHSSVPHQVLGSCWERLRSRSLLRVPCHGLLHCPAFLRRTSLAGPVRCPSLDGCKSLVRLPEPAGWPSRLEARG